MRRVAALLLAGVLASAEPALADACPPARDLGDATRPLPMLAERIRSGEPVDIAVYGSASSAGVGVGGASKAYAGQLRPALAERLPGAKVTVNNRAAQGMTAEKQFAALRKDLSAGPAPALVVWQTGAIDAAAAADLKDFGATLMLGLELLRERGVDVILVDPQYSPRAAGLVDFAPFLAHMHQAAQSWDVSVFPRHDLMRSWIEEGAFDLSPGDRASQMAAGQRLHRCLAGLLAASIVAGVDAALAR